MNDLISLINECKKSPEYIKIVEQKIKLLESEKRKPLY
jgi:hypothetical protein